MMHIVFAILFIFIFFPNLAHSRLNALSDGELDNIVAQSGITIGITQYKTYRNFEYIGYKDTDNKDTDTGGTIFFNEIEIMETLSTGDVDTNKDNLKTGIIIDVFTNPDNIPMVSYIADDFDHRFDFHTSSIEFCGTDIGKLDIRLIHPYSKRYYLSGHSDGFDFQLNLAMEMEDFDYTYQESGQESKSFHFDKMYIAGDFRNNPLDDVTNPNTWTPSGQFQIGALNPYGNEEYNPGKFDVGVDPDTNLAQIMINVPMKGSFRISNLQIGDINFGPIAIDGINVHKMTIRFIP